MLLLFTGLKFERDKHLPVTLADITEAQRRDAAQSWRRALELTATIAQHPDVTFPVVVERMAETFGDAPALLSEHETLSYAALATRIRQYAAWAEAQHVAPGDVVCLMMPNRPEYLAIWLGIAQAGGVTALINTNLVGDALRHAIGIVRPRHVIVAAEFADAVASVLPQLDGVQVWVHGDDGRGWPRIDHALPADAEQRAPAIPTLRDRALYIYTSGTTGLPKAASVSHFRLMQWTHWFAGLTDATQDDRMYNCLPMYHSIGGVVATGAMLAVGGSVAIRERFSASRFWDDVGRWDCTLFQYIGELCRYLAAAPAHPREATHRLRLACGNGLRAELWPVMHDRFRVPRIIEFYAATEGSFSLYNCEGRPGAIGRIPPFLAHRFPVAIVKFDTDENRIVRGEDGFCIRCAADEAGEAIGRLPDKETELGGRFEGYTDAAASEAKVLRDVFAPGDIWYRTGDLMRRDRAGFFYFVDRIGDTFRWKGENVSTGEVEAAIAGCPGIDEAAVYGVAVPGTEGRAGMAALVANGDFDAAVFASHVAKRLPEYARPVFLRLSRRIEATGTFKPQKQALARAGFDPVAIDEPLYVFDKARDAYVPLDAARYAGIAKGKARL